MLLDLIGERRMKMKKRISKKSLLSLLTVSAIVVTMAGSYAVWDQLSSKATAKLALDKPVIATMSMSSDFAASGDRTLGQERSYTNTATFTADNIDGQSVKATITAKVVNKDDPTDTCGSNFDVTIAKDGTTLTDGVDTSVAATNNYTITVTPNNNISAADRQILANKNLEVEVSGELTATTLTP